MATSASRLRDARIDILRGAALLIVFIDHVRGNPVGEFTPHRFGFADMAEVFIFLSGYVCGQVYDRVLSTQGLRACALKAFKRALQLYATNLVVVVLLLACAWAFYVWLPGRVYPEDPQLEFLGCAKAFPSVFRVLSLSAEPSFLSVLPLYMLFMILLPGLLALRRQGWLLMLLPSVATYLGAQLLPETVALPEPWKAAWFFNPYGWQLLFFLGTAWGAGGDRVGRLIPRKASVAFLCFVVLEVACVVMILYGAKYMGVAEKIRLAPLRLAHFTCMVIVGRAVLPRASRLWKSWWLAPIALCGQNSMVTYCSGAILATFAPVVFIWPRLSGSAVILLNELGSLLVILSAWASSRLRRHWSRATGLPDASNQWATYEQEANRPAPLVLQSSANLSDESRVTGGARRRPNRVETVVAGCLLSLHAVVLGWIDYTNAPTLDEVAHLAAGIHQWQYFDFSLYKVNPPLVRTIAALPVLLARPKTDWNAINNDPRARSEFQVGQDFVKANGARSFWLFALARWACIPFSLIGGYVCYRWASELYGGRSGLLALGLWCVCPNILANGAMITPDLAASALGVAACFIFYRWLMQPTWKAAVLAGVLLGAAELTKTTWIILFALWPHLWLAWTITDRAGGSPNSAHLRQVAQLAGILLIAVYLMNCAYGWDHSFQRLGQYEFVSEALNGKSSRVGTGNRFAGKSVGYLPIPFPQPYVEGIDVQRGDFERTKWSYRGGVQQLGGWWYWYGYALLFKLPSGSLLLALLAILVTIVSRTYSAGWRRELNLVIPMIAIMTLVSFETGFSRYLRYVLPCFPFAFIWISKIARAPLCGHVVLGRVVSLLMCWVTISSAAIVPHSLSYFNEVAGGPLHGHAYLLDANIDWGQDLLYLRRWLEAHPEARPLHLAYFGFVDPKVAGISAEPAAPVANAGTGHTMPRNVHHRPQWDYSSSAPATGPQPGWYAVSVNNVLGYKHFDVDNPYFTYFLRFKPVATAGYSIYIYHLTSSDVNGMRRELGLPPFPNGG
jgi:hypothetical protein